MESLLRPATIGLVTGTLIVWAGSHFFGVGEIVDIILLGVGAIAVGFAVFEGADELLKFVTTAGDAHSTAQLDEAGQHFARAVTLLGISTIQAVLLRGQGRALIARGKPQIYPRIEMEAAPPGADALRLHVQPIFLAEMPD